MSLFSAPKPVWKDGHILCSSQEDDLSDLPVFDKSFVEAVFDLVRDAREERGGDFDVLVNADLLLRGVEADGVSRVRLPAAELEPRCRLAAKASKNIKLY